MRTLWNVVSFLAVVHLLALLMFLGWLWHSQRLDRARIVQVRELFALTVPEVKAAAAKSQADSAVAKQAQRDEAAKTDPPIDSATQLELLSQIAQQEYQSRRRLDAEKRTLNQQLAAATADLGQRHSALQRERSVWEQATDAERKRKNDEQFQQTVRQYEQIAPKQAKGMLMQLVNDGKMDQAVAYLDAMTPRAATKILKEFKTVAEIELATELLEKVRTFGAAPMSLEGNGQQNQAGANPIEESSDADGTAVTRQPTNATN